MLDVKFVGETKPMAKFGWERIKVIDMTVFSELIWLGLPTLPWEEINRIKINSVPVARDAHFLGHLTDLSQPVRSLRLFPARVHLTFDLVMVTANNFLWGKLDIPCRCRCRTLSQEELLL
jgi:hypothetical protein